ncbi:MAG: response regulator [Xanthomonadaceae bacterium]|nr:response regulator [Xanthomonadaceae bacterium]
MTSAATRNPDQRVLMLLATARDASMTSDILAQAGIDAEACSGTNQLEYDLAMGAGAVLVCEEALVSGAQETLARLVAGQPRWSDLPVLVLTRRGADSPDVGVALEQLGNVTLLERPLRLATLISTVRTNLRARQRQYQIRDQLIEQELARAELAEVARRKDEFLAMLAHELRNPLAPIRNALHLLGADENLDAPSRRPIRAMMERQVNHMVRLVDDLVDMSRISRGTIELRREPTTLSTVIRNAVDSSAPLVAAGKHTLTVDVDDGLTIDADPVRIAQVFGNLLNNAAKYAEPGGHIALSARRDDDDVLVSVVDDGIGIEPEMLPQVFELFTQERRAQHRAQDGLGIGLTLVRTLVEMHGGRVEASSKGRGCGAEFVVRLPLAVDVTARDAAIDPTRTTPALLDSRIRILVVDDNRDAANSLGMVLDVLQVDNRITYSGEDAIALVGQYAPDAVLLDIGMPGMDGYEVARRIRRAGNKDVLLVAVTGWSQVEDRHKSCAAGFDHHLSKPVEIDGLQALLAMVSAADDIRRGPMAIAR